MKRLSVGALALMLALGSGCTFTKKATSFNGLTDYDGKAVSHINVSKVAINILIKQPLVGDASLDATVDELTREAKAAGASQVRIVQSKESTWWFVYPPFSLIICPVISNAAADVR